jgi:hypothetical protein
LFVSHLYCSTLVEEGEHEEDNEVKTEHRPGIENGCKFIQLQGFKYVFKRRFTKSNIR